MDFEGRTLRSRHAMLADPTGYRRGISQLLTDTSPAAGSNYQHVVPGQYWERVIAMSFIYAAGAAAGYRDISLQIDSGDGNAFYFTPIIGPLLANQAVGCYGSQTLSNPQEYVTSQSAEGEVTTPAAGATITSLSSLPAGDYTAEWTVALAGTLAQGTDNDNFLLSIPGTGSVHSINEAVAGNYPQENFDFTLATAGTVKILANNLATTGAIYDGQLTVIPLQGFAAPFQLPDIVLQPGWTVNAVCSNIQSADQFSNVQLLLERYASNYADGQDQIDAEEMFRRVVREAMQNPW
jgi:hypothetical protein